MKLNVGSHKNSGKSNFRPDIASPLPHHRPSPSTLSTNHRLGCPTPLDNLSAHSKTNPIPSFVLFTISKSKIMVIHEAPNILKACSIVPSDPLVFGFWKVPKNVCSLVCYNAIKHGYRRLDCACDYGNEEQVGIGIKNAIQDGLCTRDELFVTSKLWNTYHHPDHVQLACHRTLQDLQLSYVDEYLVHFPISMEYVPFDKKYPPEWTNLDGKMVLVNNDMCATWKAMEALQAQGMAKTIGVCNFSTQLLRQIFSTCKVRPSTLQIELHPHNSQTKLVRFAHENGMNVTAFSTFGSASYVELSMATTSDSLMTDPTIVDIAQSKKKSPAQVLIRWALQRNTFPLTKTTNEGRMEENRNVMDFALTDDEMNRINALNKNHRYNDPGVFCESGMGTFCPIYE
jgi:diketogulonate reductase-like aldo/keto reductase